MPTSQTLLSPDDRLRFARYAEARDFCEGAQWLGRPRRGETRLTFNYARAVVRKTAAYVFPAPVTFTVPAEGDEAVANAAEQALAALVAEVDLGRLDVDLCIEASTLGDAAVKVTWDAALGRPEVAPVDPGTLAVRTAPDNPRRMREIDAALRPDGGRRGRALRPLAADERQRSPRAGRRDVERNPVARRGRRSGRARRGQSVRLDPLRGPAERVAAGPRRLLGRKRPGRSLRPLPGAERAPQYPQPGAGGLRGADRGAGERRRQRGDQRRAGAKWELPEGARAYLLDLLSGGGVGLHAQYIDLLFRTLHDLSETPRTAFGDSGRDLSGAALEVEVQPLVQKVARKRRGFDAFYRARNARLLDLLERFGGERLGGLRRTAPVWPIALPSDLDASVRNAAQLVAAGIHSRRTAVASLGGTDPEAEWAKVVEEMRVLGAEVGAIGMEAP